MRFVLPLLVAAWPCCVTLLGACTFLTAHDVLYIKVYMLPDVIYPKHTFAPRKTELVS
jgi:hypothetical protein